SLDEDTTGGRVAPAGQRARQLAREPSSLAPVLMALDLESKGSDRLVVDVSPLVTTEVKEFSPRPMLEDTGLSLGKLDAARSCIEDVRAYATGIRLRSLLSYPLNANDSTPEGASTLSVQVNHHLLMLPDRPMRPRYLDPRVGYFTADFDADDEAKSDRSRDHCILRYRLEKKDPSAALSEPVRPIT